MPKLTFESQRLTEFLVGLLNTPSPTGYHEEAIPYIENAFRALEIPNATFWKTNRGALVIELPGTNDDSPRALTAHTDTLGAMVAEVKSNGRLRLTQLGGYPWPALENETVTIRTADNRRYRGSVLTTNNSIHAYGMKSGEQPRDGETLEVRVDARTTRADETRALGIEVGDFVFLDPRVELLETGFIRSRHLDDKASVACIYSALHALKQTGHLPKQRTTILISIYEETGTGATSGFPPDITELLAVDMAVLGPAQNSDEFSAGICVKDSGGPYHPAMVRKLTQLAKKYEIPTKLDVYPYYGSDATAFVRSGGDVRIGLIGPGVDASHAYERTHIDGLMHITHLIARYLLSD